MVTSRTFTAAPSDPSDDQKRWAAVLHFGKDALLSGRHALTVDGWSGGATQPFDVLVGANDRRAAPDWVCAHRQAYRPRTAGDGVPRATVDEAVIDAAAWATSDRQAVFIVLSVLQQELTGAADIRRILSDRPAIHRHRLILQTLAEFSDGITTMGERDFAHLCADYDIRTPDRQVRRKDRKGRYLYLDVYFDAERVVVEIDGLGHLNVDVWVDDQERQNEVVLAGDRVFLRTSTVALRWEPWVFMEQLLRALAGHGQNLPLSGLLLP